MKQGKAHKRERGAVYAAAKVAVRDAGTDTVSSLLDELPLSVLFDVPLFPPLHNMFFGRRTVSFVLRFVRAICTGSGTLAGKSASLLLVSVL
jgi:hypothetical protein